MAAWASWAGSALGLDWGAWQVIPMISARMMPDRKSKVDCSTCRTADPARNPCPRAAHAQQYEHAKARGCFFSHSRRKSPRRHGHAAGNPRCQVGYIYRDASAHGYVHPRPCSLIIPPTVPQYRSPSHRENTTYSQHHAFLSPPRHQSERSPNILQHKPFDIDIGIDTGKDTPQSPTPVNRLPAVASASTEKPLETIPPPQGGIST